MENNEKVELEIRVVNRAARRYGKGGDETAAHIFFLNRMVHKREQRKERETIGEFKQVLNKMVKEVPHEEKIQDELPHRTEVKEVVG